MEVASIFAYIRFIVEIQIFLQLQKLMYYNIWYTQFWHSNKRKEWKKNESLQWKKKGKICVGFAYFRFIDRDLDFALVMVNDVIV